MKVRNMISNKGTTVPNQFIITDDEGNKFFQSYDSIIVKKPTVTCNSCPIKTACKEYCNLVKIQLDSKYWNYSNTTSKYRNIFLNETKKETEAKIKSGEYILCNLN